MSLRWVNQTRPACFFMSGDGVAAAERDPVDVELEPDVRPRLLREDVEERAFRSLSELVAVKVVAEPLARGRGRTSTTPGRRRPPSGSPHGSPERLSGRDADEGRGADGVRVL